MHHAPRATHARPRHAPTRAGPDLAPAPSPKPKLLQVERDARAERQRAAATEARLRELLRKGSGGRAGEEDTPPSRGSSFSREELRTPPPHATIDGAFTAGSAGVGSGAGSVEVEVQTEESGAQIVTCDVRLLVSPPSGDGGGDGGGGGGGGGGRRRRDGGDGHECAADQGIN